MTEGKTLGELYAEIGRLREQQAFADGVLGEIGLGLWSFELDGGKPPRMYGNAAMDALVGCNGAELTPEEYYRFWFGRVDPAHLHAVKNVVDRIVAGELAEVRYPYHHPTRGIIQVVCGGRRDMTYAKGVRIVGRHQDITELVNVRAKADALEVVREQARVDRDRAVENQRRINRSLEVLLEGDFRSALDQIMAMWCEALGAQWCYIGECREERFLPVYGYTVEGEAPYLDLGVPGGYVAADAPFADYYDAADYLMVPDFPSHPFGRIAGPALPDASRSGMVASCYSHRLRRGKDAWGAIVLFFRERRVLAPDEIGFLKAAAKGVELAMVRDGNLREIRDERDRALAAEKSKRLFFSSVSHDIRTPLNAIIGCTELMMSEGTTEEERREHLTTISSSGKMLARLVVDILDLSKLEDGTMALLCEPTDLPELARSVLTTVRTAYRSKGLEFVEDLAPMPRVSVDPLRVQQILSNLLTNACKYTDSGRVVLRTRWNAGRLEMAVSDTGKGIAKEDMTRILNPFVQVADCNHRDGTGLGLAICQKLVRLMGGELGIRSEPGKGSTFTVTLPSIAVAADVPAPVGKTAAPTATAPAAPKAKGQALRALVVDDAPVNRRILSTMLRGCGVGEVVQAADGREAADILAAGKAFDVVFTDYWMPNVDGLELVGIIRKEMGLADLPVFLVTADVESVERCRDAGVTGFLLKPFSRAELRAILDSVSG